MKLIKQYIKSLLPKRPADANKGTFGKVLVIAGSEKYPGAAYLACAAIYRVGAGLVTLVTDREVKIIISRKLPELTYLSYHQVFEKLGDFDVILIGPGLGQSEEATSFVKKILKEQLPKVVLDGDGLNILSKIGNFWDKLKTEAVLTPHPGEMSRLTGISVDTIQSDRENVAEEFSKKWKKIVVLKGANTVIASPAGEVKISPFANPVLASAGTGDILAGTIAGFIAQGLDLFNAASTGVYIHGLAGEKLRKRLGETGGLASDLLPELPLVIKELKGE